MNYAGGTGYNGAPQAWIGTCAFYDTPGSERDSLVFATKEGTGTTGTGTDIPTPRMVINPFGNVGIGTTGTPRGNCTSEVQIKKSVLIITAQIIITVL